MISLIENAANTEATETRVPFGKGEVITNGKFTMGKLKSTLLS
jgi:hypothetical protein